MSRPTATNRPRCRPKHRLNRLTMRTCPTGFLMPWTNHPRRPQLRLNRLTRPPMRPMKIFLIGCRMLWSNPSPRQPRNRSRINLMMMSPIGWQPRPKRKRRASRRRPKHPPSKVSRLPSVAMISTSPTGWRQTRRPNRLLRRLPTLRRLPNQQIGTSPTGSTKVRRLMTPRQSPARIFLTGSAVQPCLTMTPRPRASRPRRFPSG